MKKLTLLMTFVSLMIVGKGQIILETGSFTDPRDGHVYQTITIDIDTLSRVAVKRTWYAENNRYEVNGSHCYKDEDAYCEKYGRLYTFDGAVESCPQGWRVPTAEDWFNVFDLYGGVHKAGEAIKEAGPSGLNLQYEGFGEPGGYYHGIGVEGYYWDAEEKSNEHAGLITIHKGTGEIYHAQTAKYHRNATRCILDHE